LKNLYVNDHRLEAAKLERDFAAPWHGRQILDEDGQAIGPDGEIKALLLCGVFSKEIRSFTFELSNEQRLLFATRNGTPWDANMHRKRRFRSLLKALNIQIPKGNGFHAFRHANAALMDRFSIPMKVRQQRLGHSNPGITLGIYTHVVGEDSQAAASKLGEVVWAEFRPLTASN